MTKKFNTILDILEWPDEYNGFKLADDVKDTDVAGVQYSQKLFDDNEGYEHWAYMQLEEYDNGYRARGVVDLSVKGINEDELAETVMAYGFNNLPEFKGQTGNSWQQILTKMLFELCPSICDYIQEFNSEDPRFEGREIIDTWLTHGDFNQQCEVLKEKIRATGACNEQTVANNELMISLGNNGWLYFPTGQSTCERAIDDFLHNLEKVGVNTDNIRIKECSLRNEDGEEIDFTTK